MYVVQAGLKLTIILPQHPEYWDYRHESTYLGDYKPFLTFVYLFTLLRESVCAYTCHSKSVDIRGQFSGAGSLLPCGSWGIKLRPSDMAASIFVQWAISLDNYLIINNINCAWDKDLVVRDEMGGNFFPVDICPSESWEAGSRTQKIPKCKVAWCLHVVYKVLPGALDQLWNSRSTSLL